MGQELADRHRQRRGSAERHRSSRVRSNIETCIMSVYEALFTDSSGTEGGRGGASQGRVEKETCDHTTSRG